MVYVDGAMNRSTGEYSYASVTDRNGNCLIRDNTDLCSEFETEVVSLPVGIRTIIKCKFPGVKQQNNGAELIAAIVGIRIAKRYHKREVYSDSQLIVSYWSKKVDPKKRSQLGEEKYQLILQLIDELKNSNVTLVKVPGDSNPADLGYHR